MTAHTDFPALSHSPDERGSIKTGKYADFILVTKDVLTCPETEIHDAKPAATYFEGKKVFSA